jgi:lipopolysaccharide transport system ATP-binding protein
MVPTDNKKEPVLTMLNVGVSYVKRSGMFKYSKFWPLKDVSLNLYHGESLGVIGRNGAGKSTLLRLLAGIIAPEQGLILNNGYQASLLSLQVGFLPYLTGRVNAMLSGMLLGLSRNEMAILMDKIITFAELEEFIDQPIRSYSAGMKARLGFSVAFNANPDILLIDEVIGVGDEQFRKKSAAAMRQKIRSNKTVVLVSHATHMIQELCDRVVWIDNGTVRMEGKADSVLANYLATIK